MNIEMPALRLLFSGRDDAGEYIFTVLSYRPDNYDKFRGDNALSVTEDMLDEFLSEHKGIILGDTGLNITEGDAVAFAYIDGELFYLENGTILRGYGSELVYRLKRICRGKDYLFDSGWFNDEFYQKLAVIKGAEETIFKVTARNNLTRADLSHVDIDEVVDGEVSFYATGLRGTNSGVTVYSDIVSKIIVTTADIENSGVSVIDMSNCNRLRELVIGDAIQFAKGNLGSVAVIFPKVAGKKPVGSLLFSAREVRLIGVSGVQFSKIHAERCLFSVDGEVSAGYCMIVNCNCADELHLRIMTDAKLQSGVVLENLNGLEKLFIRAESLSAWKGKSYKISKLKALKVIEIEVPLDGKSVELGNFIDYIFDYPLPSVYELTVKFSDGGYVFDDEEYRMDEIFPSLKRLTICGNREGGNDRKLIVPDGCAAVYKE
jgi:hypothetical protein